MSNVVIQLFNDAPHTTSGNSESFTELVDYISAFEINLRYLGFEHNETSDALVAIVVLSKLSERCEQNDQHNKIINLLKLQTEMMMLKLLMTFLNLLQPPEESSREGLKFKALLKA